MVRFFKVWMMLFWLISSSQLHAQNADSVAISLSIHQVNVPAAGLSVNNYLKVCRAYHSDGKFYRSFAEFAAGRDTVFSWRFADLQYQRRKIKDDHWVAVDPWKMHYIRGYQAISEKNRRKYVLDPSACLFTWSSQPLRDSLYWNEPMAKVLQSFLIYKHEVTNEEYKEFITHVRDSTARTILAREIPERYISTITKSGDTLLNWKAPFSYYWHRKDKIAQETAPLLVKMFLPEHERFYLRKEFDTEQIIYKQPNNSSISTYPDTMAWMRDFPFFSGRTQQFKYLWHSAYHSYPVSGVTKAQSLSYLTWKFKSDTQQTNTHFDLPLWVEWYYANVADVRHYSHMMTTATSPILLTYNEHNGDQKLRLAEHFERLITGAPWLFLYPSNPDELAIKKNRDAKFNREFNFFMTKQSIEQNTFNNGIMFSANNVTEWLKDEGVSTSMGLQLLVAGNNALKLMQHSTMGKNYPDALDYRLLPKDTAFAMLAFRPVQRFAYKPAKQDITLGDFSQLAHAQTMFNTLKGNVWYTHDIIHNACVLSNMKDTINLFVTSPFEAITGNHVLVSFDSLHLRLNCIVDEQIEYEQPTFEEIIEDEEEDVEDLAPSLPNKEHFAPGVLDGIYEAPPTEILISFWGLDPVCGRIFIHINPNDTYIYKIQSFSFHEITLILENIVDKP